MERKRLFGIILCAKEFRTELKARVRDAVVVVFEDKVIIIEVILGLIGRHGKKRTDN